MCTSPILRIASQVVPTGSTFHYHGGEASNTVGPQELNVPKHLPGASFKEKVLEVRPVFAGQRLTSSDYGYQRTRLL